MKLQKLELNAFRGATQPFSLEFDPAKPITMLFGENGSGKSTISDALICLCTNDMGSLDDKSSIDKSHLVASGCQPNDLKLTLQTDNGVFTARYAAKKISHQPGSGQPRLRHLRRSSVVALSTAAPAARYDQLAEYFDLSGVVKSENTLRALVKGLKDESGLIISTLVEVQRILEQIWRNEGAPMDTWEAWAESETQKDLVSESNRLRNIRLLIETGQQAFLASDKLQRTREEGVLAAQNRETAESKLNALQTQGADPVLLALLQQAHDFIATHIDHEQCPVCEQTVQTSNLLASLHQKLEDMAALRATAAIVADAQNEYKRLRTLWQAALDECVTALNQFAEKTTLPECPPALANGLTEILASNLTPAQMAEGFQKIQKTLIPLLDGLENIGGSISKTLDQHRLIDENWRSVLENRRQAELNDQRLKITENALKVVETTRKAFIDAELAGISADVDDMYKALHPGEQLGDIRLFLKEKGKNSLELQARFHQYSDIAPQSLYSESHLDTLALCIFFALAKRYGGKDTILLLDDVLSACDETHLDRFVDLLHKQAKHFAHVIVTTHYRPWRDRYRQQRAPNEVHFIDLKPWSLSSGIGQRTLRPDLLDLQQAIASGHRRETAACAGVVLENMLDFLTMQYGCLLRRNPKNVYTLNELLDAVLRKLANSLRIEHFDKSIGESPVLIMEPKDIKALLIELKQLSDLRNIVGAHYNPAGAEASDHDVHRFGQKTLELARLLCCPVDGNLPNKADSGSYWETRKGTVRLHPLREP